MASNTTSTTGSSIALWIVFAIIGFFTYGGDTNAALGIFLLSALVSIMAIVSLIPVVGWIAHMVISWFIIIPWVQSAASLHDSRLITVIFVVYSIIGLIYTCITTYLLYKILK